VITDGGGTPNPSRGRSRTSVTVTIVTVTDVRGSRVPCVILPGPTPDPREAIRGAPAVREDREGDARIADTACGADRRCDDHGVPGHGDPLGHDGGARLGPDLPSCRGDCGPVRVNRPTIPYFLLNCPLCHSRSKAFTGNV